MAVGPAPKAPGEKRRRNKESFEELPADGYAGEYPRLQESYQLRVWDGEQHRTRKVKFLANTRRWYDAWATSPMATEFTLVHWLRLQSIARLQDRFDRGDMSVAAELRQALAGFGGTPYDVRRLGRTITRPGAKPAPRQQAKPATSSRRSRLSVVK